MLHVFSDIACREDQRQTARKNDQGEFPSNSERKCGGADKRDSDRHQDADDAASKGVDGLRVGGEA